MGYKPKYHFKDVEPSSEWRPYELGFAPTALAVSTPERNWEVWGRKKSRSSRCWTETLDELARVG